MKNLTKLLVFGVTVSVCVGATIVPASADTMPEPAPSSSAAGEVETARVDGSFTAGVTLTGDKRVVIGNGAIAGGAGKWELSDDGGKHTQRMDWRTGEVMNTWAVYPVSVDGLGSDLWIETYLKTFGLIGTPEAHLGCGVFQGRPGYQAGTLSSLLTCDVERHGWDNDFDVTVSVNKLAESSGTITASNVDLADGTFRTDVAYHHAGAGTLTAGESTSFDAVLMRSDTPFYENQARTEFSYQIVDAGRETGLWVAGLSTNHRGWNKFSADGRCAIYDGNPLEGEGRLDDKNPIQGSGFTCTATGNPPEGIVTPGQSHFDGTYTITKG